MSRRPDPFTLEVVRNSLNNIAEEMSLVVMRSTCARTSAAPGWSLRELGAAIMASDPLAASAHAGNAPAIESVHGHAADPPHADVAMLTYQWNSSQANCRLYIRRAAPQWREALRRNRCCWSNRIAGSIYA